MALPSLSIYLKIFKTSSAADGKPKILHWVLFFIDSVWGRLRGDQQWKKKVGAFIHCPLFPILPNNIS